MVSRSDPVILSISDKLGDHKRHRHGESDDAIMQPSTLISRLEALRSLYSTPPTSDGRVFVRAVNALLGVRGTTIWPGIRHRRRRASDHRVRVVDRLALPLLSSVRWLQRRRRPGSEETRGWKATDRPATAFRLADCRTHSSVNAVDTGRPVASQTTHT